VRAKENQGSANPQKNFAAIAKRQSMNDGEKLLIERRQRGLERAGAGKTTCFECHFHRVRIRGRREIRVTSLSVRARKRVRFSVLAVLALVAYLVATWLANR
jgi:hypothetical protein